MKRRKFTIVAVYDTETTNYLKQGELDLRNTRAFPVLFIDNDIREVNLYTYQPDVDDRINFYRTEQEMLDKIESYIEWGMFKKEVPIICAYNLMFDLQPLMQELDRRYDIRANAQSSTNVYTLDLYEQDTDTMLLRFWDTYHLEMRSLKAMGKTSGLVKAMGDWDYDLIRTPETPLTEQELFYAGRDTQVIPHYLQYLLKSNEFLKQEDLGNRVLTKTSIVRQMARRTIGRSMIKLQNGKKISLEKSMLELCRKEQPQTYGQYGIRKACFRGGYTFTAARTSMQVVQNVVSVDVTSMHHTFINGRRIPEDFNVLHPAKLRVMSERVLNTTRTMVLERYNKPFDCAFHARFRFYNIRLRKESVFDSASIALLAESKFLSRATIFGDYEDGENYVLSEDELRSHGWHDQHSDDAVFAFGKLYEASSIIVHLTELELWSMSRVYEWDRYEVIGGEGTWSFRLPPDFVTAQSNVLYSQKDKAKFITEHYVEGQPYPYNVVGIPDGIAEALKNGTCSAKFFESWYTGTVKGMFNGIYGTMAQDIYKPTYKCDKGDLVVDKDTLITPDNFDEKSKITNRVLYTYGMRIVGGSRMHMVIAMELIHEAFGDRVRILGGDTDSMKMSCDNDVTDKEIEEALKPIAVASKQAIDETMARLRKTFPEYASPLTGIGSFIVENKGRHYDWHIECWNKCRVSFDSRAHVTCAGLSRPEDSFTIEDLITVIAGKYGVEEALNMCIGFNVYVKHSVSHSLEKHIPAVSDVFDGDVTDYLGNKAHVIAHESEALYNSGRWLGETLKVTNIECLNFLKNRFGRKPITYARYLGYDAKKRRAYVEDDVSTIMEVSI